MKIDAILNADMATIGPAASALEDLGYQGIKVAELNSDPFLPLALAAEHTQNIELVTSVAVAFARNPMTLAQTAHDLNAFSRGRFVLGLGTQVRPHIERRFSMPWYKAPRQMREFLAAMDAIFDCWYEGARLDFEGEYYRHDLMPKTFTPNNTSFGRPKILLSATGPLMTKVAAECSDGLIMHPFSTERYIREVNLPAIEAGLANRGLDRQDFEIDFAPMIATGETDADIEQAIQKVKDRIAFYGSTPGYRQVLELHGWGDLQTDLNRLMKSNRQAEMAGLISNEILASFALVGEPKVVAAELKRRFSDIIDRSGFNSAGLSNETCSDVLAILR